MADLKTTESVTMNGTTSDSEPTADSPKTNGSPIIETEGSTKNVTPDVEFAESLKIAETEPIKTTDAVDTTDSVITTETEAHDSEDNATTTEAEVKDPEDDATDNGNVKETEDDESPVPETSDLIKELAEDDDDVDSHTPTLEAVPEDSQESAAAAEENQEEHGKEEKEESPMEVDATSNQSSLKEDEESVVEASELNDEDTMPESTKTEEEVDQPNSIEADENVAPDEPEVVKSITVEVNKPEQEEEEEEEDDVDDDDEEPMTIDEAPNADNDSNLDENEVEHIPIVQEVHELSDSDDDDAENTTEVSKQQSPKVEHMEVDGVTKVVNENGHTAGHDADDDDKPVSIGSDSDEEEVQAPKNGVDKPPPSAYEDTEEDCVVIEDDDKSTAEDLSPRRSGRSRKSVLRPRELSAFDQDIEEVTEDPLAQPAAKKPKINSSSSMNITIQDARSLAVDPLATSYQHQFKQSNDGFKKEPTLVLIDTNSIMNRANAASVQALQNQNITVHPVSGNHQSTNIYPTNIRASITPVMPNMNNIKVTNSHNITNSQLPTVTPLLPALTDDMFVLEAPSFIVPYIYEKPPGDNLRDIVETIRKELADQKKQEDVDVAEKEAKELEAMSEEQRKLAELAKAADANKKKSSKKKVGKSGDDSWDESDTSTDDEASDSEQRTKVLIKEADHDMDSIKTQIIQSDGTVALTPGSAAAAAALKRDNYFESPLGKFFMDIGINLVQEQVQTDLLRQQKKKLHREGESAAPSVEMAINSLKKNLEHSKQKNKIFKFESKRCEYCNFKSESALAMAHHYEAPHLNGQMYKCNFCAFEARPPYDILFHMEAIHNIKARLEKAQTYHQCPNCPFEDNGKSKLARHALVCIKKFRPEINLNPPIDWEPPAKIPRIKPRHGLVGTATAYQAMAAQAQRSATTVAMQRQNIANSPAMRGRGRPQTITKTSPVGNVMRNNIQTPPQHLVNRSLPGLSMQNTGYQMHPSGQFVQNPGPKSSKNQQQPSISITPLPRQSAVPTSMTLANMQAAAVAAAAAAASSSAKPPNAANMKPGQTPPAGSKSSFVICEICDGYIKDLDQLRNHMQWMHKVKIHPKMIYNRPPLNCQKCQFRFFTDQGLERHLLGSHGLVTSSMQEAANKGKDSGRCPVCGRMYQWKLLNHVSRDHNMTLKPAHLSYKCTVCTATFGMYKQFENHVYSAHSTVAKKAMDGKSKGSTNGGSSSGSKSANTNTIGGSMGDSLLKPLKINDEITIIPQPASHSRQSRGGGGGGSSGGSGSTSNMDSHVIEIL